MHTYIRTYIYIYTCVCAPHTLLAIKFSDDMWRLKHPAGCGKAILGTLSAFNWCALQEHGAVGHLPFMSATSHRRKEEADCSCTAWWARFVGLVWWTAQDPKAWLQLTNCTQLSIYGTGTQSLFSQSVTVYWFQHVPTCQNAIPGLSVAKDTFQRREANAYRIRLHWYLCLLAKQSYAKLICSFDIILIVSIPPKRVVCMCGYWRHHSISECCAGLPNPEGLENYGKLLRYKTRS